MIAHMLVSNAAYGSVRNEEDYALPTHLTVELELTQRLY